ncbi:MAG TPA: phosphoenolpyruvate--protein phosphotransferase [Vicinamibacterales bacterium]|nr:phosphoenolpyruvate--protein phosphotransferase [Vicinamibacterales bacterium]
MHLTGVGVSPGIAVGRALVLAGHAREVRFLVAETAIPAELERLRRARDASRRQLEEIKRRIAEQLGSAHAYLFDAQLLMLDDPMLVERAAELIRTERINAEWAVRRACDELVAIIERADDPYLRERRGDIADVVGRLTLNLRGGARDPVELVARAPGPVVLVADELPASVAAQMDWSRVAGFATDSGSRTYHTAILARSLGVPAVAGLGDASTRIAPGTRLALDGATGEVIVDPSDDEIARFHERQVRRAAQLRSLHEYRHLPAVTADGVRIVLEANIERPEDIEAAREAGAEGIGLYRSEFLLSGGAPPDEKTQYEIYRRMVEQMAPAPVTVRTFDTAGPLPGEAPGFERARFGLRGVRLSLATPDVFRTQLRALLRAAPHGRLRVMFPFVTSVDELRQARAELDRAEGELRLEGLPWGTPAVGAMLEVPSAALIAELIAGEVDFMSLGTNDLVQYCVAADRNDSRVGHLYEPLHPAVLRLLRLAVRGARRRGVPLALCGEIAADPGLLALLVGLGLREFSMTPAAVPAAKKVIRELRVEDARQMAQRALRRATAREVERELTAYLSRTRQPVES